jgi:hypothetical protein
MSIHIRIDDDSSILEQIPRPSPVGQYLSPVFAAMRFWIATDGLRLTETGLRFAETVLTHTFWATVLRARSAGFLDANALRFAVVWLGTALVDIQWTANRLEMHC